MDGSKDKIGVPVYVKVPVYYTINQAFDITYDTDEMTMVFNMLLDKLPRRMKRKNRT